MSSSHSCSSAADSLVQRFVEEQNIMLRALCAAQSAAHQIDNFVVGFTSQRREAEQIQEEAHRLHVSSFNNAHKEGMFVPLDEVASETNTSKERAEHDIVSLQLKFQNNVLDLLDGPLDLMRQLSKQIVNVLGNGAVLPPSIESHYGEASQSIEHFVSQLDLIKSMVRGIKSQSNDSSSTAARPHAPIGIVSLFATLEKIDAVHMPPHSQIIGGKSTRSPATLLNVDRALSVARANDDALGSDAEDSTTLPTHPRINASSSARRHSGADEVIDINYDSSPERGRSSAPFPHSAWEGSRKSRSSPQMDELKDTDSEGDAVINRGKLPSSSVRGQYKPEEPDSGMSSSRRNHAARIAAQSSTMSFDDDLHYGFQESVRGPSLKDKRGGDSATEDIEDDESDSSYRESLDDGRPSKGRKRKEASRAQSSASKKARKESPEDGQLRAPRSMLTTMKNFVGSAASYVMGSSPQPSSSKDNGSSSSNGQGSSAKKAAPTVTATAPHYGVNQMHTAQQQQPGPGARSSGSKSKKAEESHDEVVDLT